MYSVNINKKVFSVEKGEKGFLINGESLTMDFLQASVTHHHVLFKGKSFNLELVGYSTESKTFQIKINNRLAEVTIKDKFELLLEKLGMNGTLLTQMKEIKAQMPGLILEIKVNPGDEVKKGDPILVLEAMKMENILKSPGAGIVKSVRVKTGDSVEKNQVLILF